MSKELSNELYQQIEQEAGALTRKLSGSSEQDKDVQAGYFSGYQDGASKYALLLQSEQEKRKEAEDIIDKMVHEIENAWESRVGGLIPYHSAIRLKETILQYNNYKAKKDGTINR